MRGGVWGGTAGSMTTVRPFSSLSAFLAVTLGGPFLLGFMVEFVGTDGAKTKLHERILPLACLHIGKVDLPARQSPSFFTCQVATYELTYGSLISCHAIFGVMGP